MLGGVVNRALHSDRHLRCEADSQLSTFNYQLSIPNVILRNEESISHCQLSVVNYQFLS